MLPYHRPRCYRSPCPRLLLADGGHHSPAVGGLRHEAPSLAPAYPRAHRAYRADTRKHHPEDKWAKYDKLRADYLLKVIPFTYSRGLGLWGLIRKGLVQITGLFRPVPRQMSEGDLTAVQHKSCALVAQTFMLAMSSEGYDTCPLEGIDTLRVRRLLGLPRGTKINMIVSCGIRDDRRPIGDRIRVPFESQYHRIGE